jgi:hypothetical protein
MVGGLVQQQQVRGLEEQGGEHDAGALAAGEGADAATSGEVGEVEAGQDGVYAVVQVVAASTLEAVGEVAVLGEGGFERMILGVGQHGLELSEAALQALEAADRLQDELVDGERGGGWGLLLGQVADLDAGREGDLAAIGGGLAGDDPEEGALAGAVGADETDAVAGAEGEGDGVEDGQGAIRSGDVLDG